MERGLILRLRFELDLYINRRPFALRDCPGREFIVIRENTEGTYAGEGGFLRKGTAEEIATQGSVNTRRGVERTIRYAFELARSRPRRHLTLVHKTNVLTFSGDLWERTFAAVAAEFPEVETTYQHVDAACIHFVENPRQYDVIVTDNLFGDILTDLGGAVSGGIGLAASANLNPSPESRTALFEPVHGSAPDIAGKGLANPTAAVLSGAMMLDFLGEGEIAARVRAACEAAPSEGSTEEIAAAITAHLSAAGGEANEPPPDSAGYVLYGGPLTRAAVVEMMMLEAGLPFELRKLNIPRGDHLTPEYKALNPAGLIPTLLTPDGDALYETPAIILHLAEQHGIRELAPGLAEPERGAFLSALFFIAGELHPHLKRLWCKCTACLVP